MIKIYIQTDSKMLELRCKMITAKRLLKRIAGEEEYEIILDSPDGRKEIKSRQRRKVKE